jgi:hypothetical protein
VARRRWEMPRMIRKARKTCMHQLRIGRANLGQLGSTGNLGYRSEDLPEGCEVTDEKGCELLLKSKAEEYKRLTMMQSILSLPGTLQEQP